MVKLTFEVWDNGDSTAMFQRGSKGWKVSLPHSARLVHTFEAETLYGAYQTYYDFMGWGKWNTTGIENRIFTEEDIAKSDDEDST